MYDLIKADQSNYFKATCEERFGDDFENWVINSMQIGNGNLFVQGRKGHVFQLNHNNKIPIDYTLKSPYFLYGKEIKPLYKISDVN